MEKDTIITIIFCILLIPSLGIVIWFIISTAKAFSKFNELDEYAKNKILLIEYYMVFIQRFSSEDIKNLSKLPDEEIKYFNKIHNINERIKMAREKISGNALIE